MRRMLFTAALLALVATTAQAAPMTGKVVKVQGSEVRLVFSGKPADWLKKGTTIKCHTAKAVINAIAKDTVVVSCPGADKKTKVGETVTFDKARATGAGC